MRRRAIGVVLAGTVALVPATASANGGGYLELDRTHYLPGETAVATGFVQVPERRQDLLERGPFFAFVSPYGVDIREGRPIPDQAIRVGTFTVDEGRRNSFELRASFVVPDLAGDFYRVALCNDPCTVSGFAEPLSGEISIVATEREAELLIANSKLSGRAFGLRRQLRNAERDLEHLRAQLELTAAERSRLQARVEELEARFEAASATSPRPASSSHPLVDPWVAAAVAAVVVGLAALSLVRRRRSARLRIPDTIEELEPDAEHRAAR